MVAWSCDTLARSCSSSGEIWGDATEATVGIATSIMWSASWASWSRLMLSLLEARTIRTFAGRRCRNSSLRTDVSNMCAPSPRSCCEHRRSCDGFLSLSSSAWKSCCRRCCSEAADLRISCTFNTWCGLSLGEIGSNRAPPWRTLARGCYHIVELGCGVRYGELCLDLSKPYMRVSGPEGRQFDAHVATAMAGTRLCSSSGIGNWTRQGHQL